MKAKNVDEICFRATFVNAFSTGNFIVLFHLDQTFSLLNGCMISNVMLSKSFIVKNKATR